MNGKDTQGQQSHYVSSQFRVMNTYLCSIHASSCNLIVAGWESLARNMLEFADSVSFPDVPARSGVLFLFDRSAGDYGQGLTCPRLTEASILDQLDGHTALALGSMNHPSRNNHADNTYVRDDVVRHISKLENRHIAISGGGTARRSFWTAYQEE